MNNDEIRNAGLETAIYIGGSEASSSIHLAWRDEPPCTLTIGEETNFIVKVNCIN